MVSLKSAVLATLTLAASSNAFGGAGKVPIHNSDADLIIQDLLPAPRTAFTARNKYCSELTVSGIRESHVAYLADCQQLLEKKLSSSSVGRSDYYFNQFNGTGFEFGSCHLRVAPQINHSDDDDKEDLVIQVGLDDLRSIVQVIINGHGSSYGENEQHKVGGKGELRCGKRTLLYAVYNGKPVEKPSPQIKEDHNENESKDESQDESKQ